MSSIIKVAVFVVVWEFIVAVCFIVGNVMIFEYVEPTFDDVANKTAFVDYAQYEARKTPVLMGFRVALFVLAILPFVYLFVRLLMKREQTALPAYGYPGYMQVNPARREISYPRGVNLNPGGGSCVCL